MRNIFELDLLTMTRVRFSEPSVLLIWFPCKKVLVSLSLGRKHLMYLLKHHNLHGTSTMDQLPFLQSAFNMNSWSLLSRQNECISQSHAFVQLIGTVTLLCNDSYGFVLFGFHKYHTLFNLMLPLKRLQSYFLIFPSAVCQVFFFPFLFLVAFFCISLSSINFYLVSLEVCSLYISFALFFLDLVLLTLRLRSFILNIWYSFNQQ